MRSNLLLFLNYNFGQTLPKMVLFEERCCCKVSNVFGLFLLIVCLIFQAKLSHIFKIYNIYS